MLSTLLLLTLMPLAPAIQVAPTELAPATRREAPDPLKRARNYLEVGELTKAKRELQSLAGKDGVNDLDVQVLMADVQVAEGRYQDALDTLAAIDDTRHPDVLRSSGRAYWARADKMRAQGARDGDVWHFYELARESLVDATEAAAPGDVRAMTEAVTLLLYTFGDHQAAFDLADTALQSDPDNGEARLARGNAGTFLYWNNRNAEDAGESSWARAVEDFKAAAEQLPPQRVEPLRQLSWLYEQRGKFKEAVAAAVEILERDKHANPDIIFGLARRLTEDDQTQLAARALAALVKHQPSRLRPLIRESGDPIGVAARLQWLAFSLNAKLRGPALDAIMASNPTDADVWNNYGLYLRDNDRHEESYAAYERALTHDDTDPRIVNDTAVLLHYYLKRDDDRALELYAQAIKLANQQLQPQGLDAELRAYLELALTDARNNLSRLSSNDRSAR